MMALLIGYFYFTQPSAEELEAQKAYQDSIAQIDLEKRLIADSISNAEITSIDSSAISEPQGQPAASMGKFGTNQGEAETYNLSNGLVSIDLSSLGGKVAKVNLLKYKRSDSTALILFDESQQNWSYEFIADGQLINTGNLNWTVKNATKNSVDYYLYYDSSSYIKQRYQLREGEYLVDYQLSLVNLNGKILPTRSYLVLNWDLEVPLQEFDAEAERQKSTIYYKFAKDNPDFITETKYEKEELNGKAEWISFKQQFFNSTILAIDNPFNSESTIETIESEDASIVKKYNADLEIGFNQLANEEFNYSFYFGPNHVPTLKKAGHDLDRVVPLGWTLFRAVNEYAIIPLFNLLRSFFSNYGLVILLLTLIVKLVLLPLTYKSYKSTAKMKVLKPEIDKIKEKFKGDAQKTQMETMQLYRKFGVSPAGGCLPMVLQMPILLSIFFFFPSSIELRQESFLWAEDLSRYDSILELGFSIPFYGDHVSLFTLLMTIATFLYTYMNNQVSGVAGPMKNIGYIMPIFFLGFFNNYASGLTYYYFLSNMITFTQQFAIKRFFVDENKIKAQMEQYRKTKGKKKKEPSKFQKKLEEMAKQRGIDPKTGKRK